ncbi:pseudo-response regulator 7 [Vigna unguiculata]|uniref:Pseudo-response regulator 7 n=1 Tax=Vigna unguiculata TaxID=3917 RepID=A0A4D6LIE9_VIGUN|nr:pseudo-response regulator 7 [Vigna unguiculata]
MAGPMNNNVGKGKRGLAEHNHMIFDKKSLNCGVANGGVNSGSSTEDNPRFNKLSQDGNNRLRGLIQINGSLQVSQQPPQGPVICWERFLPVRSIKVLLVEDDDSTRHVVRALLRNCSYEVTAVSNGLQAWKVLEDPENCIGLVLTEVAMPILSGIGLLCKIMNHKTLKNIPVIMMSSHDSMGIVFKCLSKGAVDFLVKPIRRNELKNLWQHVWRRCHSSSGSGSESATNTRKSTKSRSNDASENNGDSNEENDYGSKGLSIRDGSDNGSGTQSSWTKCLAQVGSPHPLSPHKQLVDAPDSTCAQVMQTKTEKVSSRWVHATEKECLELIDHLDDVAMGKDLAVGISLSMQLEHRLGKLILTTSSWRILCFSLHPPQEFRWSLAQTGNVGSCSPLANGSAAPNAEVIHNFPSHSNVTPPNQQSNGSNNINDMASTNTYLGTKPCTFDKMPESVRGLGSFNSSERRTLPNNSKKTYAREEYMEIVRGQLGSSEHEFQAEHTHYEHHHYNHISRKAAVDLQSEHDLLLKSSTNTAQQCVSSNAFGGPAESNAANYTIDGNAGESDHGSNGHGSNGQDGTLTMRTVNMENGNVASGSFGVGGIDRKNIGNGADEGRLSLREAALTKFRQKRKERCFEKRVRYHSRKKLAEQRPRIRGQFVRRIVSETKEEKDHQSDNLVPGDHTDIPQ